MMSFLHTYATPWLSLMARAVLDRGNPSLTAVLCPFRRPPMCRPVHRQFMRNELLDLAPIIPATPCYQSNYIETYSRFTLPNRKVWARKPLMFRARPCGFGLKKANCRTGHVGQERAWPAAARWRELLSVGHCGRPSLLIRLQLELVQGRDDLCAQQLDG